MADSFLVDLLASRPEAELLELREKAVAKLSRDQVELEQIEEALAKQARRAGRQSGAVGRRSGNTRGRVLDVVTRSARPVSPSEVIAVLEDEDVPTPSRGAIHNMLADLSRKGRSAGTRGFTSLQTRAPPRMATALVSQRMRRRRCCLQRRLRREARFRGPELPTRMRGRRYAGPVFVLRSILPFLQHRVQVSLSYNVIGIPIHDVVDGIYRINSSDC